MLNEKEIAKFVNPFYANKDPMHNFSHILRIKRKVLILKKQYQSLDRELLIFLIYFHGLKKWTIKNKKKVLEMGFNKKHIESLTRKNDIPKKQEEKIVCDANQLENVGKFGIKKALSLARYFKQTKKETAELQKKFISKYKFYTPLGKELGKDGVRIKKDWLKSY